VRRTAAATAVLLAVTLTGPPMAAYAAAGPINTQGQALRANVALLSGGIPLTLSSQAANWTTGGNAVTRSQTGLNLSVPILLPNLLGAQAATARAQTETGGGSAAAEVLGLSAVNSSTLGVDTVNSSCVMTADGISGGTDAANLRVAGQPVNLSVNADIGVPGTLSGKVNRQIVDWNDGTGRLTYTVRGLELNLLSGLAGVASGTVIVAESVCSGIVRLGPLSTTPRSIIPGNSATPQITVRNTGDVAAPNTVITIPAPPTGYTLGAPTVTGGGECTSTTTQIRCTGVTVPGGGTAVVSLPVTVNSDAVAAADWAPASTAVLARSTPVAAVAGTAIEVTGGGTLATVLAPQSAGAITIEPVTVPAGRTATTTIRLANQGPSDANTALTIPIGNRPAGLSVQSATVGGNACTGLSGSVITCSGVTVPSGGSATVTIRVAATQAAVPGTVWNLENVSATLNGTAVTADGRFATVSDPEVNLSGGVTINRVTGVPGGPTVSPTVRVTNIGMVAATDTTITLPAPPAGYDVGAVTTSNGTGTCTSTAGGIQCTGVTVPATGSILVTVPVALASSVTAGWTAGTSTTVTATSGDSSGQATGPIVVADPSWTLDVESIPPAPDTVRPGQDTTMTVNVTDAGPSDAVNAEFVIVAPRDTTFAPLPLTGTTGNLCEVLTSTTIRCTASLPANGPVLVLRVPLRISADADSPVTGGCVSLNNDTDCGDPGDVPTADISLASSLSRRLTVSPQAETITPGTSGAGRVRITSSTGESGLTVTVPRTQAPTGFTVTPGSGCTATATAITCTGVTLAANVQGGITVPVAVASNVVPPRSWTATGIEITDGVETISLNGTLAVAGPPEWDVTATITGPADGTVEPGGTGTLTVVAHNEGPSDATDATFAVIAPTSTTVETLTGAAAQWCRLTSDNSRALCTVDLADDADTPQLYLVFRVPAGADPYEPLPGGCVDLDGVPGCGPDDEPLDPVVLGVPYDRQVALSYTAARITPGTGGNAVVRVTAQDVAQSGLTVTIPIAPPTGLTLTSWTPPAGATCQHQGDNLVCAGVNIAADTTVSITLRIDVAPDVAQNTTWTASGITAARGSAQITGDGTLVIVAAPRWRFTADVGDPGPLPPGGTTDVDVTITNAGPSDAPPETIGILAPRNTTFGVPPAPCTRVSDTRITCTFGLPYGQPVTFRIPIVVAPGTAPGELPDGCVDADDNQICDGDDPELGPLHTAESFDQELHIGTQPPTIAPGDTGISLVRLQAGRDLTGLTVSVPLTGKPAEMSFSGTPATSHGGSCAINPGVALVCTGVDVPASGGWIRMVLQVDPAAAADLVWLSRALTVVNPGGDVAVGSGVIARSGPADHTLTATATAPADYTVAPGEGGAYQVTVTNQGPSNATDALVTLQAPYNTRWGDLTGLPIDTDCDAT
jgi:large repetitive protein